MGVVVEEVDARVAATTGGDRPGAVPPPRPTKPQREEIERLLAELERRRARLWAD